MAEVAKKVVVKNGFDYIKVINKHSTDVALGVDMKVKSCKISSSHPASSTVLLTLENPSHIILH